MEFSKGLVAVVSSIVSLCIVARESPSQSQNICLSRFGQTPKGKKMENDAKKKLFFSLSFAHSHSDVQ
jgi:hypothetical protein